MNPTDMVIVAIGKEYENHGADQCLEHQHASRGLREEYNDRIRHGRRMHSSGEQHHGNRAPDSRGQTPPEITQQQQEGKADRRTDKVADNHVSGLRERRLGHPE